MLRTSILFVGFGRARGAAVRSDGTGVGIGVEIVVSVQRELFMKKNPEKIKIETKSKGSNKRRWQRENEVIRLYQQEGQWLEFCV